MGERLYFCAWQFLLNSYAISSRCCRRASSARPSITYLENAKLKLSERLAENRRALQLARRRLKAESAQWELPIEAQRVALAAYVLAGYDATASAKYLAQYGRKRRWQPLATCDLTRAVEDLFLDKDLSEIVALTNFQEPLDSGALEVAAVYVREAKVVAWAQTLNEERGVAPSTKLLLQRAEASRLELPESARPRALGAQVRNHARKWVQRLRKRWGGRFGSIPAREEVPLEDTQAKASTFLIQARLFEIVPVTRTACLEHELEFRRACRVAFNAGYALRA